MSDVHRSMDVRAPSVLALTLLAALLPSAARAQVTVVEEEQAEAQIVERGEVRQGRGGQLGFYLLSPIYATPMRREDRATLPVILPGFAVGMRAGWEFPSGLALEVYLEAGIHGVDNPDDVGKVMLQGAVGGTIRYLFFNPSAFVPFVQASGDVRALGFRWPDDAEAQGITLDFLGGAGAQVELTAELGIEAGFLVGAMIPGSYFSDAVLIFHPFAGITIYTDGDE